jgi:hypothetical protein
MSIEKKIANFKKSLNILEIWFCEYDPKPESPIPEHQGKKGDYHFIMIIDKLEDKYPTTKIKIKYLNTGIVKERDFSFLSVHNYRKLKVHNHPPKKRYQ